MKNQTNNKRTFSFFSSPITNTKPSRDFTLLDAYNYIVGHQASHSTNRLRSIIDKDYAKQFKARNFDYCTSAEHFNIGMTKDLYDILDYYVSTSTTSITSKKSRRYYSKMNTSTPCLCSSPHQATDSNGLLKSTSKKQHTKNGSTPYPTTSCTPIHSKPTNQAKTSHEPASSHTTLFVISPQKF